MPESNIPKLNRPESDMPELNRPELNRPESKSEEDLISFAFNASHVGYWVWDTLTKYVYLSDDSLKILQLSKTEFSNNTAGIKALIHPDDFKGLKKSLNEHINNNSFFRLEFRIRRKDKSYAWVNIDGQTNSDDTNTPRRVGGSIIDVSTNIDLKQELKIEQRNLRLIFDNVPARIWFKDAHNRILRLNKIAADSMNMTVEDVEGADAYDLFPDLAKDYHEADLAVINSGQPLEGIVEKYVPKHGPHGWVRTDKLPFTHPVTNEKHVLVISTDITQQIEYENKILENSARLLQANKDLDHFAHMASHDLKAPLKGMDELARWVAEDLGDAITPDAQRMLDLLRGRVSRMETLLQDILAFSRAGKNMAEPEDVDMDEILDEVIAWLSPLGGFKIIRDKALPVLSAPKSVVELIVLNLVSNAIKHHDQDEGTINVGYKDGKTHHLFSIADDGPGIAKEYQDIIFEVFRKLRPRDQVEGSGIGLSIVKKLIETLGGKIEVLSEDGKRGTTFNVYIPKLQS